MIHRELTRAVSGLVDALNALDDAPHSDDEVADLKPLVEQIETVIRQIDYRLNDDPHRDEAYERAAAKARANDFAETGGKDWT